MVLMFGLLTQEELDIVADMSHWTPLTRYILWFFLFITIAYFMFFRGYFIFCLFMLIFKENIAKYWNGLQQKSKRLLKNETVNLTYKNLSQISFLVMLISVLGTLVKEVKTRKFKLKITLFKLEELTIQFLM